MATYSITDFKAKASQILRELESTGEEVVITRRGKPVGKLVPISAKTDRNQSLSSMRGSFSFLPELEYEDFIEAKKIWQSEAV